MSEDDSKAVQDVVKRHRAASRYRTIAGIIFGGLVASAFLPHQYSFAPLAIPFGFVAIAFYYVHHNDVDHTKSGYVVVAALVAIQAAMIIYSRYQVNEDYAKIERWACNGALDPRAEARCEEIRGIIHEERDFSIDTN